MSFDNLELDPRLLNTVTKAGYTTPTSVQAEVIPLAMEQKDILANAPTGTGKTAAYLLPAIQHLLDFPRRDPGHARVLVLTPTRELASQVKAYADKLLSGLGLTTGTLTGGVDYNQDDEMLGKNLDLLVATPGRLMDYIEKEKVACRDVEILVIDEADRMLDMGFGPTVDRIAAEARWRKQTLLFSATLEGNAVEGFARELLQEPARINSAPSRRERKKIAQYYYRADDAGHKLALLKRLLADETCTKAVIFVRTRERVEKLIAQMDRAGIRTNCLKGEMPQAKRDAAVSRFRDGQIKVLIATDVAARGLDIQGITHVINYDLPRHADTYVHRIGRTARAGAKGIAISIVEAHDHPYLGKIERYVGEPIRRRVFQDLKPQTKEPSAPKKSKKPATKAKKPKKPKRK
ncbi:ATP-dependent RNA helicase SrmB [Ferrimonas sediminicola]|uniref:ATP-dependent RNA helicase SrmB n=1 Tax=Ferrimonas sediminicola TaxID=2569538 RepID=A0A4V5NV17_9GAMM|nr:ATP-dependent RNA helicase SrmB [Ferrimonas sediminicola]TKB48648.1 ATP-dependent RNA helicase SrmB [Ferrimonas sediminicola]